MRGRVDDVVDGGRRAEYRDVSSFKVLDPVTELGLRPAGHHDGVNKLPCRNTEGTFGVSRSPACHGPKSILWVNACPFMDS